MTPIEPPRVPPIYIGIDPGKNTGFAVYDPVTGHRKDFQEFLLKKTGTLSLMN